MSEKCSLCGARAGFRVRDAHGTTAYCESCIRRTAEAPIAELLQAFRRPKAPKGVCPHCGWTDAKLEQTGMLGCPLCYEALDGQILAGFVPNAG
ncbi:MAG TPA: hypothetical protein PLX06_12760 [Fimbriimonadaceae bacterium]|nr:hypothetical protein [Fimbriimonadaceae bacterium]